MDTLQATYAEDDDDATTASPPPAAGAVSDGGAAAAAPASEFPENGIKEESPGDASSEEAGTPQTLETDQLDSQNSQIHAGTPQTLDSDQLESQNSPIRPPKLELEGDEDAGTPQTLESQNSPIRLPELELEGDEEAELDEEDDEPSPKKQKQLSELPQPADAAAAEAPSPAPPAQDGSGKPIAAKSSKKSKKKSKDVWTTTSRKGKKKTKQASNNNQNSKNPINGDALAEERVFISPIPRFPDKNDDAPELGVCLSKVYKAEKVELSEDRMSASSTKGYRMVRATRGVAEGAWYFEIRVVHLGETGHTRLGWSTEKGDLQAPVGYDANSFGYRDVDGSKVHKAMREKYGSEGYKEGDVIGFYINLPDGGSYAPNPPRLVWHKGQRYMCAPNAKEDSVKVVPGSEILYFKNGICQGVAFTNLYGGRYYPAASMYTLPNQPPCAVKFNFGPDFESFPEDFGEHPQPRPMSEVPYQSFDDKVENGSPWNMTPMSPMFKVIKEENSNIAKAAETAG